MADLPSSPAASAAYAAAAAAAQPAPPAAPAGGAVGGPASGPAPDHPLRSLPIEITISVGKARPLVRDLLSLGENAVLPLDRKVDDPVELYIGDRLIARGELQELEGGEAGQLAVRLTEVAGPKGELS